MIKKTITSIFMVPTLKIRGEDLTANGFISGYSKDASRDDNYKNAIYLLFQPNNLNLFREFLDNEYERTKQIIEDYDLPGGYVVVIYELDPSYKADFDLIRQGKYSKTSIKFQELFPKTKRIKVQGVFRNEISLQYRIFNKTDDLIKFWEEKLEITFTKDDELWSAYSEEDEILYPEKLTQLC